VWGKREGCPTVGRKRTCSTLIREKGEGRSLGPQALFSAERRGGGGGMLLSAKSYAKRKRKRSSLSPGRGLPLTQPSEGKKTEQRRGRKRGLFSALEGEKMDLRQREGERKENSLRRKKTPAAKSEKKRKGRLFYTREKRREGEFSTKFYLRIKKKSDENEGGEEPSFHSREERKKGPNEDLNGGETHPYQTEGEKVLLSPTT